MNKENKSQDYSTELNMVSTSTSNSVVVSTTSNTGCDYTVSCGLCCRGKEEMERKEPLRQRMYCLVLRQLNQMQKGVQSTHSVVEYIKMFGDDKELWQWIDNDKTLILLDGGTYLEMEETINMLTENNIQFAVFCEPDLNGLVTCISLLASELVWDRETYPDYSGLTAGWDDESHRAFYKKENEKILKNYGLTDNEIFLRGFLGGLRLAN